MAKRTSNDLQNTMQETEDRATRTPLKLGCSGRVAVPAPLIAINISYTYEIKRWKIISYNIYTKRQ